MREIKFRVWCVTNNKMKDMVRYANSGKGVLYCPDYEDEANYILMQYTGLKDKNGKEIYEGDIYKNPESIGLQKVIFYKGCFREKQIIHIEGLGGDDTFGSITSISVNEKCEIIGNIYEHSHLLP